MIDITKLDSKKDEILHILFKTNFLCKQFFCSDSYNNQYPKCLLRHNKYSGCSKNKIEQRLFVEINKN